MAPKQTDPQFKLRMPPEIKEAIEKAAAENNRSMNAEILARLEKTLRYDPESDRLEISDTQVRMFAATMLDRLLDAGMLKPDAWEHTGTKPGETADPSSIPSDEEFQKHRRQTRIDRKNRD